MHTCERQFQAAFICRFLLMTLAAIAGVRHNQESHLHQFIEMVR